MATSSIIGIEQEDKTVLSIVCHFDGFPDKENNVGQILKQHYVTKAIVEQLIALGNISILAPNVEPRPGQDHYFDKPANGVTVAYHRDRNEPFDMNQPSRRRDAETYLREANFFYAYLFKDGEWFYCKTTDGFAPRTWQQVPEI